MDVAIYKNVEKEKHDLVERDTVPDHGHDDGHDEDIDLKEIHKDTGDNDGAVALPLTAAFDKSPSLSSLPSDCKLPGKYYKLFNESYDPNYNENDFSNLKLSNECLLNFKNFLDCMEDEIESYTSKIATDDSINIGSKLKVTQQQSVEKTVLINKIFREIILFNLPISEHILVPLTYLTGTSDILVLIEKAKLFLQRNFDLLVKGKIIDKNGKQLKATHYISKNRIIPDVLQFGYKPPSDNIFVFRRRRKRRVPPSSNDTTPPEKLRHLNDSTRSPIFTNTTDSSSMSNELLFKQNEVIIKQNQELLAHKQKDKNPHKNPLQRLLSINKAGINSICVSLEKKKDFNIRLSQLRKEDTKSDDFDIIKACLNGNDGKRNSSNADIVSKIEGIVILLFITYF